MGLYDEIWWEAELPAGHPADSRLFQTKSFDSGLDRYVVTREGRLLLVGNCWQEDEPFAGAPSERQTVDVEFHGDVRLVPAGPESETYLARFTHGTLEWIKPIGDGPHSSIGAARVKLLRGEEP